jgi:hypothetical protein
MLMTYYWGGPQKLTRYLTIMTIPAAWLIALAAEQLMKTNKRWLKLLVFGLLAVQVFYGIGFALAFGPARINQVNTQNGVYERVVSELDNYEFDEIAVAGSRWELRGTVFAQLNGKDYEFVDVRNVARDELGGGTVVIYDPSFFTPAGERQLNPEDYPALVELPDNPPDNWHLLFTDEQIELFGGQPVYVYQITPH